MNLKMIRIAIIEDRHDMRQGLLFILNHYPQFICTAYPTAEEALKVFQQELPDVVLMDIDLPGMNGITCTAVIRQLYPDLLIMICTVFEDADKIFDALKAGANGYILKNAAVGTLYDAINDLLAGGAPMSSIIANKVVSSFRTQPANDASEQLLTKREKETLDLLSRGYDNQEIAEELFVSVNTVRTHIRHIYEKLQVHNRVEVLNKLRKNKQ